MEAKHWMGFVAMGIVALAGSFFLNEYKDPSEIPTARLLSDGTAPALAPIENTAPVTVVSTPTSVRTPDTPTPAAPSKPKTSKPPMDAPKAKAPTVNLGGGAGRTSGGPAIKGVVKWHGEAPPRNRLIDMGSDPVCKAACSGTEQRTENITVNENGTLKDVIVYVANVPKGTYETRKDELVLNQKDCRYEPHVFALQLGQKYKIQNSDDTTHNIHFKSKFNDSWNMTQSSKGQVDPSKDFMRAEVGTAVFKCDVHTWMEARVGIFDHPFFAVTGADGSFEISGTLPPGKYKLTAWHEKYKTVDVDLTVGDTVAEVEFTYGKKKSDCKGVQSK